MNRCTLHLWILSYIFGQNVNFMYKSNEFVFCGLMWSVFVDRGHTPCRTFSEANFKRAVYKTWAWLLAQALWLSGHGLVGGGQNHHIFVMCVCHTMKTQCHILKIMVYLSHHYICLFLSMVMPFDLRCTFPQWSNCIAKLSSSRDSRVPSVCHAKCPWKVAFIQIFVVENKEV